MELTEDRRRIRFSCLTCLAKQMLPERQRRHAEEAERARKILEGDGDFSLEFIGTLVMTGGVGAFLGLLTLGWFFNDAKSALTIGAIAGAAWGLKVDLDESRRKRQWAEEVLARPAPTVEDLRNEIRDRPRMAAERVIDFMHELRDRYELETSGIKEVDRMSGKEFEELMASVFERRGYTVRRTPATRDYGIDLILERGGRLVAVQCKRWRPDTSVGPSAIQEVYAGKNFYECTTALVVTNGRLSEQARAMAERLGVEVWERARLTAELAESQNRVTWEEYLAQYFETRTL